MDCRAHQFQADLATVRDLAGAGWGGATVSLVPEPKVPEFIKALQEGYYAKRFPNLTPAELDDACFATKPEAGACVFVQT